MFHESMSLKKNQMGMDPIKSPPPNPFNIRRRKSPESLTGFHAKELGTKLQLLLWNDFCHHGGRILVCVNLLQLEVFHFYSITNPMISNFFMPCPGVILWHSCSSLLHFDYCNIPHTHLVSDLVP